MNKKARKEALGKLVKQAEQDALIKKVAEDTDVNNATSASSYSEKVFEKLLNEITIEGLEEE
jgi:hypothetical protein